MLVLARRQSEQIRIGNDITITILRVKGQTVRVGIEAPRDIHIVRGELPNHKPVSSDTLDLVTDAAAGDGQSGEDSCAADSCSGPAVFDAVEAESTASSAI